MSEHQNQADPVVLLHLTDTHLHADSGGRMRGVNTSDTLAEVLGVVQQDPAWPPDGILATGDLVQDESRIGYQRFRTSMERLNAPVYCIAGNHDDPALMEDVLSMPPFQVHGEARFGNWTIVLLNTHLHGNDGGHLDEPALRSLDEALRSNGNQHVLIVMHHHPIPMQSAWLDGVALRDPEAFLAVVDHHQNVRGVLWGHVHQASDRQRGTIRMLSTPSTCSQFLPAADVFAVDERPPGFRWLRLYADGRLDTEVGWASS